MRSFSSIIISLLTYNFFARAGSKALARIESAANKEEATPISNDISKLSDNLPAQEGAAEEAAEEGKADITPYWRTLKSGGVLNEKYPFGLEHQKKHLESEGHKVIQKGKKYVVEDFEASLVKL